MEFAYLGIDIAKRKFDAAPPVARRARPRESLCQ